MLVEALSSVCRPLFDCEESMLNCQILTLVSNLANYMYTFDGTVVQCCALRNAADEKNMMRREGGLYNFMYMRCAESNKRAHLL